MKTNFKLSLIVLTSVLALASTGVGSTFSSDPLIIQAAKKHHSKKHHKRVKKHSKSASVGSWYVKHAKAVQSKLVNNSAFASGYEDGWNGFTSHRSDANKGEYIWQGSYGYRNYGVDAVLKGNGVGNNNYKLGWIISYANGGKKPTSKTKAAVYQYAAEVYQAGLKYLGTMTDNTYPIGYDYRLNQWTSQIQFNNYYNNNN